MGFNATVWIVRLFWVDRDEKIDIDSSDPAIICRCGDVCPDESLVLRRGSHSGLQSAENRADFPADFKLPAGYCKTFL